MSILQRSLRHSSLSRLASYANPLGMASRQPLIACLNPQLKSPVSSQIIKRHLSQTAIVQHGDVHKPNPGEELHVTFITKEGEQIHVEVAEGDNLLDIAQANNLEMEGACGGSCACSTCHVIVDPEYYDKIEEPDDDENDMLDLAFGLTETSRLGCQIIMTKELDGLRVALPAMTRNMQVKDFN
jgi:ferredoxin-2, mitochondrial